MLLRIDVSATSETNTRPVGARMRSSADPAKIRTSSVKIEQRLP